MKVTYADVQDAIEKYEFVTADYGDKQGMRAALESFVARKSVVPPEIGVWSEDGLFCNGEEYAEGWNACRNWMLNPPTDKG